MYRYVPTTRPASLRRGSSVRTFSCSSYASRAARNAPTTLPSTVAVYDGRRPPAPTSAPSARKRVIKPSYAPTPPCAALCLLHTIATLMDKTGIHPGGEHAHIHVDAHGEHHEELGWWRRYVFSQDHKVIGIQYAITGLLFLLFVFTLMMIMRWSLAYPGSPIPLIGRWLGQDRSP